MSSPLGLSKYLPSFTSIENKTADICSYIQQEPKGIKINHDNKEEKGRGENVNNQKTKIIVFRFQY
jgi:hypothetical protein